MITGLHSGVSRAILALAALGIIGCGSAPPPPPKERVVLEPCSFTVKERVRVVEKGALGATVEFSLKVANPNSVPVVLQQVKYDVTVGSSHLGKSQAGPRTTIKAGAEAIVPLRLNVSYVSSGAGVLEAIAKEQVVLKMDGSAIIACADNRFDSDPLDFPVILK